jgi:hypothetical protein
MTIIDDIYDKIGNILTDMRDDLATAKTFTSIEVYYLYVQRYPDDEEYMKAHEKEPLKRDVPGRVWEYSRKIFDEDMSHCKEIIADSKVSLNC